MKDVPRRLVVAKPRKRTFRTLFQALVGIAPMVPLIYEAATRHSPEAATGAAAVAITISGVVSRVMALPSVEAFLQKFVPWLSANA